VASLAAIVAAWSVWEGVRSHRHPRLEEGDGLILEYMRFSANPMPSAVRAAAANLADDTPVIGVRVGVRARAYANRTFTLIAEHALNDVLGGAACTVVHCPQTGCTRVFVVPQRDSPLEIAVGGWIGRGEEPGPDSVMLLRIGEAHYFHDTGEALQGQSAVPYPTTDFEQTTWGKWRKTHPDTDVVTGPLTEQ
jgi:hypothetical protein